MSSRLLRRDFVVQTLEAANRLSASRLQRRAYNRRLGSQRRRKRRELLSGKISAAGRYATVNNSSPPPKIGQSLGYFRKPSRRFVEYINSAGREQISSGRRQIVPCHSLGDLPHSIPIWTARPRRPRHALPLSLREADGVLMSSPEYAHGVAGRPQEGSRLDREQRRIHGSRRAHQRFSRVATRRGIFKGETLVVMMARVTSVRSRWRVQNHGGRDCFRPATTSSAVTNAVAILADAALSEETLPLRRRRRGRCA